LPVDNFVSFWEYLNDNSGAIQAVSAVLTFLVTVVLVIITTIYVFLTKRLSEVSEVSKSQLRFQKKSEEYRIQQEIIDSSLKFIFKIKAAIDELRVERFGYLKTKKRFPDKEKEFKEKFFQEVNRLILEKRFFEELMYISFKLKCLKDKDLWKDLEQMGDIYEKMINVLMSCEDMDEYEKIDAVFMGHEKDFVIKCLDISKVGGV
jgi:uncharacterized protein (DUF2132 family)